MLGMDSAGKLKLTSLSIVHLHKAVAALGEITGAVATEAMLDGIFARFCIGK